jgi:hypothetical protein
MLNHPHVQYPTYLASHTYRHAVPVPCLLYYITCFPHSLIGKSNVSVKDKPRAEFPSL